MCWRTAFEQKNSFLQVEVLILQLVLILRKKKHQQGAVLYHRQEWENKLGSTSSSGKGFGVTVVCKLHVTLQF